MWNETRKVPLDASGRADTTTQANSPQLTEAALQKRLQRQKRKDAAQMTVLKHAQEARDTDPLAVFESDLREAPGAKETASYAFRIPATSEAFSWYEEKIYPTLQEARDAGLWTYPSNQEERAKCAVFADLWQKGYFMGNGLRFGGDWLVYPGTCPMSVSQYYYSIQPQGDPLRYHSHFVATVYPSPRTPIQPMEIVAHGRLGTATKKSHLLCGWDESTNQVTYISVEWAGFG